MSTKDTLARLAAQDDPFDFVGWSAKAPEPAPEPVPAVPATAPVAVAGKQVSARLDMALYRRLKLHLMESEETQQELFERLLREYLDAHEA